MVKRDGVARLKVATRTGLICLERQVCYHHQQHKHHLPGNAALPAHNGMLITRQVQEWACLLGSDVPFETAKRLLGWLSREPNLLSTSQLRRLVCAHGQVIRHQEALQVAPEQTPAPGEAGPCLVPATKPRGRPAWPQALNTAVSAALETPSPRPPTGVSSADWERVLCVRREEAALGLEALRCLGPQVGLQEVTVAVDDVLVRQPAPKRWWALHTARVSTADGYVYLSGSDAVFTKRLSRLLQTCSQAGLDLTLLADGQEWIRDFYEQSLAQVAHKRFLLDWYHLKKKCCLLTSMICRSRAERAAFEKKLLGALWRGQVQSAQELLAGYAPQAKNVAVLQTLMGYLQARTFALADYRQLRAQRCYIGSGQAEKANDLLVARRQKRKGMHWSLPVADALAALKTVLLNQGWERYWKRQQIPPLYA